MWGVASSFHISFWWLVYLFHCGVWHVRLLLSIVKGSSSFFWLIVSQWGMIDFDDWPIILRSRLDFLSKFTLNMLIKFYFIDICLTSHWQCPLLLYHPSFSLIYLLFPPLFVFLIGCVLILLCTALFVVLTTLFPPLIHWHPPGRFVVLCWAELEVHDGTGAVLWREWDRLRLLVPRTSLIACLHWFLVHHTFGATTVENCPDFFKQQHRRCLQ